MGMWCGSCRLSGAATLLGVYAAGCFLLTTLVNVHVNGAMASRLSDARARQLLSSEDACKVTVYHGREAEIVVVQPYDITLEEIRSPKLLEKLHSYYVLGALAIFLATYLLVAGESFGQWLPLWSALFVIFFWGLTLLVPKFGGLYTVDQAMMVTAFAYSAIIAAIYVIYRAKIFEVPSKPTVEQTKMLFDVYSLFIQAGFAVFVAFCVSLMWELSKGVDERYKEAAVIFARLQEPANEVIACHAAAMSVGVLAGILAMLVARMHRLIHLRKS